MCEAQHNTDVGQGSRSAPRWIGSYLIESGGGARIFSRVFISARDLTQEEADKLSQRDIEEWQTQKNKEQEQRGLSLSVKVFLCFLNYLYSDKLLTHVPIPNNLVGQIQSDDPESNILKMQRQDFEILAEFAEEINLPRLSSLCSVSRSKTAVCFMIFLSLHSL